MATELKKLKRDAYNDEECVIVPPVDIYETESEYMLKAEMPGITREGIDITLNNKELEINGKIDEEAANGDNLKYSEYNLYNYHRKFMVGDGIDGNAMSASFENGVLTLVLPKSEELKPKKIEVKVEH